MFNPTASLPVDCNLVLAARVAGAALLGLAVVALEAWLRVPVRPLLDVTLQEAQARVVALFRQLAF
jgi:hypothetical protein